MIDQSENLRITFPAIMSFGQQVYGIAANSSPYRRVDIQSEEIVLAYGGSKWNGMWTFNIISSNGEKIFHVSVQQDEWIKVF